MPNTRELRRRIKSVKNTSQITKAMQMVAATKMRKAQLQALTSRPYTQILFNALGATLPRIKEIKHPFLVGNDSKVTGVLLLTTDKSLCGALNTNVFRACHNLIKTSPPAGGEQRATSNLVFYTAGKKGRQFLDKLGQKVIADFENHELISFRLASQIARLISKSFLNAEINEVFILYPDFVSTLRQEPKLVKLLPMDIDSVLSSLKEAGEIMKSNKSTPPQQSQKPSEFIFEPTAEGLLDYILTHNLEVQIYQSLLETKASEHSARMIAMQNATNNAKELVEDLQLSYNQIRQSSITTELLEITSAQSALE